MSAVERLNDAVAQPDSAEWAAAAPAGTIERPARLIQCYRFELAKLLSQWRIRLLMLACWIVPAVFVGVVSRQSSLPADTVFGRLMNSTGWAGALVVLAFGCEWALPLLTSLVAGDVFAVEDRLGTWRHLLIAVRSPRRIFAAKALAGASVILLLVTGLAVSGTVGGLVSAGSRPLIGLDGSTFTGSQAAGRVVLAWLCVLAPTLAFAAVGLLGSVALGRSPVGLLLPAVLAVLLAVLQMLPLPVAVRLALPSQGFIAWRGLFTQTPQTGPLIIGLLVGLAWAAVATAAAYRLFLRRDSLATSYAHLYRFQAAELHRPAVTETQLRTRASCDKGGSLVADEGPGNDWRCVVSWHLPDATAVGSAIYQLDVTADGRYVADGDGPQEVNGFFQVHTSYGIAANPLWQFDGSVDLLTPLDKD